MAYFQLAFLGMKFLLAFLIIWAPASYSAAPEWFSDYVKSNPGCDGQFLCAVGEGDTLAESLSEARLEVARFFQSKIKSSSQVSNSSEQSGASPDKAVVDEWTNKTMSVETSELISGLEIKKQEQIDGRVYVLMTLDRRKTADLLKEKIQQIDTENAQLMELNSRFTYPKILKNLDKIEVFMNRYSILVTSKLELRVKKETIQDKLNKLTPMKTALITRGKKLPAKLNHTLIAILSPLKVVIVPKKDGAPYTLRGEIVTEEQYFKVDGFKKLNVIYKLELLNSKNAVVGKMSAFSEQVARNSDHATELAIPDIKEALQDNLDQLSSK